MKKLSVIVFLTVMVLLQVAHFNVQGQTVTNRYSMKLNQNEDGTYSLKNKIMYEDILDMETIEDLTTPYTYQPNKLTADLYSNTRTEIRTYKSYESYDLKLAIDKAETDSPAPVMFFCHGGGWSRGSFKSGKTLARYLAQQYGITCVRISYTLANQPGAKIEVSIEDVMDAVKYISENAESLNVDPERIGFYGSSAGGHLSACAAMKCKETKVFVGNAGVYDLTVADAVVNTKSEIRKAYFRQLDPEVLRAASPINMIPKKKKIAVQLYHGTGDITVKCAQSKLFAEKLKKANRKSIVELVIYENYGHNLNNTTSDKMEEIFFKTAQFIAQNL